MSYNYQQNTIIKRKIAIIGAGFVGSSIAYALTIRDLARKVILIDIDYNKASGEALDIQHGIPYMGRSAVYAGDYTDCLDCDLIVITAGRNRRPGENRLDLINDNKETMRKVVDSLKQHYTRGVILVISNPVEVLTSLCTDWMGLPKGMIFGTGCLLDTSRLVSKVAEYIQLSTKIVKGFIVGEHGYNQTPIWSRFTVGGINIDEYCKEVHIPWNDEVKNRIADEVKSMGATIISNKGRTHYGIATCVCSIADAILNQRPTIASVCSKLDGEYGLKNIVLSLPSIIGVNGVEHILEENFNIVESEQFLKIAEKMQRIMEEVDGV